MGVITETEFRTKFEKKKSKKSRDSTDRSRMTSDGGKWRRKAKNVPGEVRQVVPELQSHYRNRVQNEIREKEIQEIKRQHGSVADDVRRRKMAEKSEKRSGRDSA